MEPDGYNMQLEFADDEDTSSEDSLLRPWDPSKIRITTKNFSLREVVEQIQAKEIDLAPDFQRDFVWKGRQRTRLIESILLGIPLPAFYFNQDEDGRYQVVDGVQRLSTIYSFMSNQHTLHRNELEYLFDLDGKSFDSLDPAVNRRFRSAQIVVHVIEPQTPDEVKYDIFNRVNTLGSPLSAQEIRHAMSKDRSRKFLHELCALESFDKATDWLFWKRDPGNPENIIRETNRMMDSELALRFCAFSFYSPDFYKSYPSMDAYLVGFLRFVDGRLPNKMADDQTLSRLIATFNRSMNNCYSILGKDAFRRYFPSNKRRPPLNRAIFEAQALALAGYDLSQLLPKAPQLRSALLSLFDDDEYTRSVTVGTGSVYRIEYRLEATKQMVRKTLDN